MYQMLWKAKTGVIFPNTVPNLLLSIAAFGKNFQIILIITPSKRQSLISLGLLTHQFQSLREYDNLVIVCECCRTRFLSLSTEQKIYMSSNRP